MIKCPICNKSYNFNLNEIKFHLLNEHTKEDIVEIIAHKLCTDNRAFTNQNNLRKAIRDWEFENMINRYKKNEI